MYQARALPLWKFLAIPIDVHFVPLHRLVTWALGLVAPASFAAAVGVLLAFHLVAMLFLYSTLELLRPTWLNAVFVAWYGTHVYIGVLFTWWTSGLHRLPYVFFFSLAAHTYAKYRWQPSAGRFLGVFACFVGAMGFFEKALFIPIGLAGIEAVLWRDASVRTRRAAAALLGTLAVAAVASVALWRHAVGPQWATIGGGASFLFTYLKLSWLVLLLSAGAQVHEGLWPMLAIFLALVAVTVIRRRSALRVWLVGALLVSISLEITGVSPPRVQAWGLALPYSHRYYPDVMFVLVLFSALACHRAMGLGAAADARSALRPACEHPLCTLPALVALVAVAVLSYRASAGDMKFLYTQQSRVRAYMTNLTTGLEPLRKRRTPPTFVDGAVPYSVIPMGGWVAQQSVFVEALGVRARFVSKRRTAYRILPTGKVVFGGS